MLRDCIERLETAVAPFVSMNDDIWSVEITAVWHFRRASRPWRESDPVIIPLETQTPGALRAETVEVCERWKAGHFLRKLHSEEAAGKKRNIRLSRFLETPLVIPIGRTIVCDRCGQHRRLFSEIRSSRVGLQS
jgi:hypothetical protein